MASHGGYMTITILDLPEILDVLHEALDHCPEWERRELGARIEAILQRARWQREGT